MNYIYIDITWNLEVRDEFHGVARHARAASMLR